MSHVSWVIKALITQLSHVVSLPRDKSNFAKLRRKGTGVASFTHPNIHKDWEAKKVTNFVSIFCLLKSSENNFNVLRAFYLIMWHMKSVTKET